MVAGEYSSHVLVCIQEMKVSPNSQTDHSHQTMPHVDSKIHLFKLNLKRKGEGITLLLFVEYENLYFENKN